MTLSSRACRLGLSLSALVIFGFAGCKSNGVQAAGSGQGSALSGPPTMNADYGARNARVCAKVTSAPTPAQAAALVQCQGEGMIRNDLWLITDLQVA